MWTVPPNRNNRWLTMNTGLLDGGLLDDGLLDGGLLKVVLTFKLTD